MPTHDIERDAYTVEQTRHRLGGVANQTIYNLINSGELRSITIGTRRLIPAEAITEFIKLRASVTKRPVELAGKAG